MSQDAYYPIHTALQWGVGIYTWKPTHLFCGQGMIWLDNHGLEEKTINQRLQHAPSGSKIHSKTQLESWILLQHFFCCWSSCALISFCKSNPQVCWQNLYLLVEIVVFDSCDIVMYHSYIQCSGSVHVWWTQFPCLWLYCFSLYCPNILQIFIFFLLITSSSANASSIIELIDILNSV